MTGTRRDWLKWTAMGFALVATFHAEYTLATAAGMHHLVALAVPGALDAYVVRTLTQSREVLTAVLAMVAVNVCSHLVHAGVLAMGWPIIAAVSAIAPLVLWRVHALGTPGEWRRHTLWGVPRRARTPGHASTVSVLDEQAGTEQVCSLRGCTVWGDLGAHERAHELAGWGEHDVNVGPVTSEWDRHADMAVSVATPDYVPPDWSRARTVTVDDEPVTAGVLHLVPPLPDGYVVAELTPADMEHMARARVLDSEHRARTGSGVPVRVLKAELGVGTPRAQRVRAALDAEHGKRHGSTP